MNNQFDTTVVVESHANYGSFKGNDGGYYKPDSKAGTTLEQFVVGQTYQVSGYTSESGKTKYITKFSCDGAETPAPLPKSKPQDTKTAGRRITTGVSTPPTSGVRDFKREAKGKTLSLFVAAQLQAGKTSGVVEFAEELVTKMDTKGYF